jgi:hypothetical protein
MSESVLKQLGEILRVSGMPWLNPNETFTTSTASLTAKILCTRHNAALSPLDAEAGHFFSILRSVLTDLDNRWRSEKIRFHLVSGEAIELWMIKVACGLYFSVASKDREALSTKYKIDLTKVAKAFFERRIDDRGGLYFEGATGTIVTVDGNLVMAPLSHDASLRFGGVVMSLHGFKLQTLLDAREANPYPWLNLVKRPTELVVKNDRREHHIMLTWPYGTPEMAVVFEKGITVRTGDQLQLR